MHPALATIPHSGTTLILDTFRDIGYTTIGMHPEGPWDKFTQGEKRVAWSHLHVPEKRAQVKKHLDAGALLICPIRHPVRNFESHKYRSANGNHLDLMFAAWEACLDQIFPRAYLLPVDADVWTRAKHLKAISNALGFELPVNWNKKAGVKPEGNRIDMPLECSRAPEHWFDLGRHHVLSEIYGVVEQDAEKAKQYHRPKGV